MSNDLHILIFARYPVAGQAKTRLMPVLGAEGAARLHRRLTEQVVRSVRRARQNTGASVTVLGAGAGRRPFRAWLGGDLEYEIQPAGDLGVRMAYGIRTALERGARAVVLVGSDLPRLSSQILELAFEALQSDDLVLGPAADGGYYLIGVKQDCPALFQRVDWGTDRVLAQTLDAAHRAGLTAALLPQLTDVDRPEDLALLEMDPDYQDVFGGRPGVSVIIPTLNEAQALGPVIERVWSGGAFEVIVVDGGSRDGTPEVARRAGARVLDVAGGRAVQQNAGAGAATGARLLFLHGDTLPPLNFAALIHQTLDEPSTVAGAFRFKTDLSGPGMRLLEWTTDFRSRILQMPYGDQGLFLEKRVFEEMGGFRPLPIMEDFELVRRLARRGRVVTRPEAALTSGRRWQKRGLLTTTVLNQIIIAGYFAGTPLTTLRRIYRGRAGSRHEEQIISRKETSHESAIL